MNTVLFSLGLFVCAFLGHWLLWRVWIPRRQIMGLLWLFQGALGLAVVLVWCLGDGPFWPARFWQWAHVILCYEAVSLAYIEIYSSLEQDSASMAIVLFVADAGGRGRTRQELYDLIDQDFIIGYRFASMLHGKLIEKAGEVYRLTPKGAFWARLFRLYRSMFRLKMGG